MKRRPWHRPPTVTNAAIVTIVVLGFVALAPIGRRTLGDAAASPSPIPVGSIPVPTGGVALFFGPQYCRNLVTVSPDGAVPFELGSLQRSRPGDDTSWTWRRMRGMLPTETHLDLRETQDFISTVNAIPRGMHDPQLFSPSSVHSGMDRGTVWGAVRNETVDFAYYRGEADPFLAYLGNPAPPTEMVMPTPPPFPPIPSDAIAFVYESSLFIVHRSGAITMQTGEVVGRDTGSTAEPAWLGHSLTYEVEPISPVIAWKIVTLGLLVYVPPGCPGLDDARTYRYLVIVTNRGVSNGLFCHAWSPLRDDLMSVVRIVYSND